VSDASNGLTVLFQTFDVEFDSLLDQSNHLVASRTRRHTAREVRDVGTETGFTSLDYHSVFG
jgi:hypothetical protein